MILEALETVVGLFIYALGGGIALFVLAIFVGMSVSVVRAVATMKRGNKS